MAYSSNDARSLAGDPPQFLDPDMFLFWKKRFEVFVNANYPELWKYIEFPINTFYSVAKVENNLAMNLLYRAIPDEIFGIIFKCQTAHDIWRTLEMTYGGDLRDSTIDSLTQEFETFKMLPGESTDRMFCRYNLIITGLKKLGVSHSTEKYVAEILSGLPSDWNDMVKRTIKERKDFGALSLDDLYESLRKCEMELLHQRMHNTK